MKGLNKINKLEELKIDRTRSSGQASKPERALLAYCGFAST
jgi:hypothetical protein